MPLTDDYLPGDIAANRRFAALSYLGPLVLIPKLSSRGKSSPFARLHANQGMYLLLVEILLAAAMAAIAGIRVVETEFGVPVRSYIPWPAMAGEMLLGLVCVSLQIAGIAAALGGRVRYLPVIGGMHRLRWFR